MASPCTRPVLPDTRYEPISQKVDDKSALPGSPDGLSSSDEASRQVCLLLDPDVYEEFAKANPYCRGTQGLSVNFLGSSSASNQSTQSKSFADLRLAAGSRFPVADDALKSLVPSRLKIPIKAGHQHQPTLENCESSGPAHSRVASFDYIETYKNDLPVDILESVNELDDLDTLQDADPPTESSHKKLFGENGWLDGPEGSLNRGRKNRLLKDLGKKIKQQFVDITEDVARNYPGSFVNTSYSTRVIQKTTVPITLDLSAQAKLYSELEFVICSTANEFILQQYYDGHISQESIKKINSFWGSKNRPRVTEFHFDQATQRELIMANRRTLRFTGECATNPMLLHSNLRNWKAIAQEMNIRTFCLPDSAIRKHLHDIHRLLEMLNVPMPTLQAFHELTVRTQEQMMQGMKTSRPRSDISF